MIALTRALPWVLATAASERGLRVVMLPGEVTDAELVRRAQGGDRWAEEALYRRHVYYVTGAVLRLVGRRSEAEDIVQEAFAVGLDRLRTLHDGAAVRAWLAQIAVRIARRQFRRMRLTRALGLDRGADDATLGSLVSQEASPEVRAELARVDAVLQTLDGDQRFAWMLRRVEGWELEEVAEACNCSLATVKRRIAVADEKIEALRGKFEGPASGAKRGGAR